MLDHGLVLKSDELFLVGEINTDGSGEPALGLYARDTRHLSRCRLTLNGERLDTLSVRVSGPRTAEVVEANRALPLADGEMIYPHAVAVEQHIELNSVARVRFRLRNFSDRALPLTLAIRLAADFRDLFDIRGFPRDEQRGTVLPPAPVADGVTLAYVGRDQVRTETSVQFSHPPDEIEVRTMGSDTVISEVAVLLPAYDDVRRRAQPPIPPSAVASFSIELAAGQSHDVTMTVTPRPADGTPISAVATLSDGEPPRLARVSTDNPFFDRFVDQGAADLEMLQTSFPEGSLPAAGIPWFIAPFGRDSLIVGLQTLHTAPERAAGTLRVLAAHQGSRYDPAREEEPGKILHEVRHGEMARLGEIPHTPYYGSVDATPLFVLLFAETVAWTGDNQLYEDLLPNARRALEWIARDGDVDGDDLVEYQARQTGGAHIIHQVWKDSHDSLHHLDGRPAFGSIAAVEVQGYVYAAYRRLAEVVAIRGETGWAESLRARAERVRRAVEERFWLEDEGYYAQALDGEKTPVRAISSNAGHLLFCELPDPERASRVATRLRQPDLDAGWGIRTLSARMPSYNPMSYHNGSIWPHDNSLIADGLSRYGHHADAHRIAEALFAASGQDPLRRLPELYCGFPRTEGIAAEAPVPYPVSCSPQAWAAGASRLLVRGMLGPRVDVAGSRLLVAPALPDWLSRLTLDGIEVFGQRARVTVRRQGARYEIEAEGPIEPAATP